MSYDWHHRYHAEMIGLAEMLTLEQFGALCLLVDFIYWRGPLVDEERRLARLLNCCS